MALSRPAGGSPSVLHFHRRHPLRVTDAGRASTSLMCPGLRLGLVRSWGLPFFDARPLQATAGRFVQSGAPVTEVVLRGQLTLFGPEGERRYGPGALVRRAWSGWNERWEGDVALVSAYAPGGGAALAPSEGRLGRAALARLRRGFERAERGEQVDAFVDAVLTEVGWPELAALPRSPVPPEVQGLAAHLGAVLSRLWEQPQLADLSDELSVSTRQVRRQLRAAEAWLGPFASAAGWRTQLRRLRLVTAVAFLACPRCRVADVARDVGYGSVRAMLTAFQQAGLPPPTTLRGPGVAAR